MEGDSLGLWDGDCGSARLASRVIAKKLVARPYIDDTNGTRSRPSDWQLLLQNEDEVRSILSDLLLDLCVDGTYHVAWAEDCPFEEYGHHDRLAIKQNLPMGKDETLALISLRRRVMVYETHGASQGAWVITMAELRDCFDNFPQHSLERDPISSRRDDAFNRLVARLARDGFVRNAGDGILRILPGVPAVMTAACMEALERAFDTYSQTASSTGPQRGEDAGDLAEGRAVCNDGAFGPLSPAGGSGE